MLTQSLRLATPRQISAIGLKRTLVTTPRALNSKHTVDKTQDASSGLDVQSDSARKGMNAQAKDGARQPFDTATESQGGQAAPSHDKREAVNNASTSRQEAQAGSFKDHVGGQDSGKSSADGSVGGQQEASAPSVMASVKNALGMGTSKKEHEENKTAGGKSYNTRAFHTSARANADKGDATDAAQKDGQGARAPHDTSVQGDQSQHLKHSEPSKSDSGKGNAGENPSLPSKGSAGGKASYHTSARRLGDATNAAQKDGQGARAPHDTSVQGDQSQHLKHSDPSKSDSGKGNAGENPSLPSKGSAGGKASYHTSARRFAKEPPGGYANSTPSEAGKAGYDAPGQAFPKAELNTAPPPADPKLVPSSQQPHSSTGNAPPHPVTTQAVKDGKMEPRTPPPTSEEGRQGLKEGWKHRDQSS